MLGILTSLSWVSSVFNFFKSPLGKVVGSIGLILAGVLAFQLWLGSFERKIRQEALDDFNTQQQQLTQELQQQFDLRMEEVLQQQEFLLDELITTRTFLIEEQQYFLFRLDNGDLADVEPVETLKEAIQLLRQRRGLE